MSTVLTIKDMPVLKFKGADFRLEGVHIGYIKPKPATVKAEGHHRSIHWWVEEVENVYVCLDNEYKKLHTLLAEFFIQSQEWYVVFEDDDKLFEHVFNAIKADMEG